MVPEPEIAQAAEEQLQSRVLAAYEQLTQDMTTAQLLPVPAGAPYLHMSSAVLLRGSLRVKGQAFDATAPPAASGAHQSCHAAPPSCIPWLQLMLRDLAEQDCCWTRFGMRCALCVS